MKIKMNRNQIIVNLIALSFIVIIISYWIIQGAEIFTKTKILVDKTSELDKMLGVKNEVWVDKFILGLDYSIFAIAIIVAITILINYILKTKRKESL